MNHRRTNLSPLQERMLPHLLAVVEANSAAAPSSAAAPAPWWRDRRSRTFRAAVSAVAAAALAVTGALALRPAPAFAVETMSDGRIRIEFDKDFDDPDGLERTLRQAGLTIDVTEVGIPGCEPGKIVGLLFGGDFRNVVKQYDERVFVIDPRQVTTSTGVLVSTDDGPAMTDLRPPAGSGAEEDSFVVTSGDERC